MPRVARLAPLCLCALVVACDDGPDSAPPVDAAIADRGADPDAAAPDGAPVDGGPIGDAGAEVDAEADAEPPPPWLRVRFDPDGAGFYRAPWPSDARLTPAGTPELDDFPPGATTLGRAIDVIEAEVGGFATMPVIYVAYEDDITGAALPEVAATTAPDSPIQLVELGADCAVRRVPVESSVRGPDGVDRFTVPNLLQVKNTVGALLTPRVPYALIVTTAFGSDLGKPSAAPPAFAAALAGDGSRWGDSLAPLRDCLPALELDPAAIAIATVFTPQDPVETLQALRDRVMDPAQTETRPPVEFTRDVAWSRKRLRLTTYSGLIEFPVYQQGLPPYLLGGGFVLDGDGVPLVQRWEEVPFAVAMRDFDEPFDGPRPAMVFIDGTGWQPWTHLYSNWLGAILDQGYVVFSFMPQFHGERAGQGGAEANTFNFTNPAAVRTNFRQQAAETSYFLRVIREQLAGHPDLPLIDADRVVYGGHSQGSLAGALNAAVESEFAAYVFNGLASYLTLTILERTDILDFERIVRTLLGGDRRLDLFHPGLQIMQLGGESVDPHNYARLWRGTPARPHGNHVFVVNGWKDDTTTPRGMDQLTLTAELPTFGPPGWDIDPLGIGVPPVVQMPAAGNATGFDGEPVTLATWLDPVEGHGTIYRNAELRRMSVVFWQTARDGVPILSPAREMACLDGSDDEADGQLDCADTDCASRWPCVEQFCDDERDDDGDGLVDCDDDECADHPACQEEDCGDGLDDDGDGLTDCEDPGCAARAPCAESICTDGLDDDGDGLVDCADDQCAGRRECTEFSCLDGRDNDRDGLLDCADDECLGYVGCPEPSCDDGTDEDGNGLTDCDDPRCAGRPACPIPGEAVCDDAVDDDGDGLVDCADPDCALADACRPAEHCADGDLGTATGVAVWQDTLDGRTDDYLPGDCTALGSGKDSPDLALRWTAPADGVYIISTLGSVADTVLTLLPDDCDRAREFGCSDDQAGLRTSAIALEIDAGQSVVIVVSAYEEDTVGAVRLHIYPRP